MGNIITGLALIVLVVLSVRKIARDKKNGKSCQCGGNCAECSGCH